MSIIDSGTRRKFDTGAVRDIAEGKGRCDLLPLGTLSKLFDTRCANILCLIEHYIRTGEVGFLYSVIETFIGIVGWDKPTAMLEVAKHYEEGANKYKERNWEIGIPLHCYIDSGVRHFLKCVRGDEDENHERAFLWNILGAIWTQEHHPDLIDLPFKE